MTTAAEAAVAAAETRALEAFGRPEAAAARCVGLPAQPVWRQVASLLAVWLIAWPEGHRGWVQVVWLALQRAASRHRGWVQVVLWRCELQRVAALWRCALQRAALWFVALQRVAGLGVVWWASPWCWLARATGVVFVALWRVRRSRQTIESGG